MLEFGKEQHSIPGWGIWGVKAQMGVGESRRRELSFYPLTTFSLSFHGAPQLCPSGSWCLCHSCFQHSLFSWDLVGRWQRSLNEAHIKVWVPAFSKLPCVARRVQMALSVPWRQGDLALIIFLLRVMRSTQRGGRYQREEERVTPRYRITGFSFAFCLEWPPTWSRPKNLLMCFAQSNLCIEWHVPTAILPFSWDCRAFCPLVMTTPLPSPTYGSGRKTKAPIIGLVSVLPLTFKF